MSYFDLGSHRKPVSTTSKEAQLWFDRGLNWCFGFNQEEGVACFQKALEYDPQCVMAYWGIAYAAGPFYNLPWRHFGEEESTECTKFCYEQIQKARQYAASASALENALVEALSFRFQKPHPVSPEDFDNWDKGYSDAMRKVYKRFPDDHDVAALFIEALITRTPWKLWDVKTGIPPAGADTYEALEVCEHSIATRDKQGATQHPAILHLHIHILEMSNEPERAMRSADLLGTMCPDAGHMNHMPAHIYALCGQYEKSKIASIKSIRADDMYVDYAGAFNFYTSARCHDLHMQMYTCMFLGQYTSAIEAAEKMCQTLTTEVLSVKSKPQLAVTMEGYYSMKMHVLIRFGRWQDIVDTPMPVDPRLYCVSTAMHHYAKGIAFATLGLFEEANLQRQSFHESFKHLPSDRSLFNNTAASILAIGEKMLDGEMAYHQGNYDKAFVHLRESVELDDNLEYTEPWAWMHPPRHALAALLMEQGYFTEAEDVYRTDLGLNNKLQRCAQHPHNVWALHGLVECLKQRGEDELLADLEPELVNALLKTDVEIRSSCMCRTKT